MLVSEKKLRKTVTMGSATIKAIVKVLKNQKLYLLIKFLIILNLWLKRLDCSSIKLKHFKPEILLTSNL